MAGENEPITFDDLTTVYRMEKSSSVLTSVRKDFYKAVQKRVQELCRDCDRFISENPDSIAYESALDQKKRTLVTLKQIVEYRMRKIANMALLGAIGANNTIDNLTAEEKDYYNGLLESSKDFMKLSNPRAKNVTTMDVTMPQRPVPDVPMERTGPVHDDFPLSETPLDDGQFDEPFTEPPAEDLPEDGGAAISPPLENNTYVREQAAEVEGGTVVVRILEDLPGFSGPSVDYRLSKEDIVCMSSMLATALINRGKAILVPTA